MTLSRKKKQAIRFAGMETSAQIIGVFLSVPTSFLVAAVLGPTLLGGLRIAALVKRYATYANLGFVKGFRRQYTEAISSGDPNAAAIEAAGFTSIMLSALLSIAVVILIYAGVADVGSPISETTAALLIGILVVERLYAFLIARAQSRGRFDPTAYATVILNIVDPLIVLIGLLWFGFNGVILAWLLIPMIGALVVWLYQRDFTPRLYFDARRLWSIMLDGFIQHMDGLFTNLINTLGLALSVLYFSASQVGIYAYAEAAFALSNSLPLSLQSLFLKSMMDLRAKSSSADGFQRLSPMFAAPLTLYMLLIMLTAGTLYLGYTFLIPLLLPRFVDAIPIMGILLFAQMINTAQGYVTQFFVATNQIRRSALVSGLWAAFTYVVIRFSLEQSADLSTLALAVGLALAGYATVFMTIALRQVLGWRGALWQQLRYWVAAGCVGMGSVVLHYTKWFMHSDPDLLSSLLLSGAEFLLDWSIFAAGCLALYAMLFADQRIGHELRQIASYFVAKFMLFRPRLK